MDAGEFLNRFQTRPFVVGTIMVLFLFPRILIEIVGKYCLNSRQTSEGVNNALLRLQWDWEIRGIPLNRVESDCCTRGMALINCPVEFLKLKPSYQNLYASSKPQPGIIIIIYLSSPLKLNEYAIALSLKRTTLK